MESYGGWVCITSIGALLGTAFWLWMLIDCLRRDPDRYVWVWIILLFNFPGALFYFILRRASREGIPQPLFVRRWLRRRELWSAESAARNIGNAHKFVQLGDLCLELGMREDAAIAYRSALEKEPGNIQASWGAGQAALAASRFEEAAEHVGKVLEQDPAYKFGDAYLAYGEALLGMRDFERAREHLEKGIGRWRYPQGYVMLATALLESGEERLAREHLQTVIRDARASPKFSYQKNRRWIREANRMLRRLG